MTNNKSNLEFLKLKYGNKAHYLPNPVMINKFKNKKRKIILSVGSLHDQKNYFQLLRCLFFSLKNEYWTYNILGEGELREEIKKYIKSLDYKKSKSF